MGSTESIERFKKLRQRGLSNSSVVACVASCRAGSLNLKSLPAQLAFQSKKDLRDIKDI